MAAGANHPDPGMSVNVVAPGEERTQKERASWIDPKRSGKPGRYLSVLNCASEYQLALETCGRECDLVTPRSESSSATGLDVIELPRSA